MASQHQSQQQLLQLMMLQQQAAQTQAQAASGYHQYSQQSQTPTQSQAQYAQQQLAYVLAQQQQQLATQMHTQQQQQQQQQAALPSTLSAWQQHRQNEQQQELTDERKRLHELKQTITHEQGVRSKLQEQLAALKQQDEEAKKEHTALDSKMAFVASEDAAYAEKKKSVDALRTRIATSKGELKEQEQRIAKMRVLVKEQVEELEKLQQVSAHRLLKAIPTDGHKIGVRELRYRYPNDPLPANLRYMRCFTHDEGTVVPVPEPAFLAAPDVALVTDAQATAATALDGVVYTVKLLLLSACPQDATPTSGHVEDILRFVGARVSATDEFTCYGGGWCYEKDGGDPATLETLCKVLKRHVLQQCGVDLSKIPLARFCTFTYDNEIVEYLAPDPGRVQALAFKPTACVESRMLAREPQGPGAANPPPRAAANAASGSRTGGGDAPSDATSAHAEEEVVAVVVSEPAAVPLRRFIERTEEGGGVTPATYAVEHVMLARCVDSRLRRTATQRVVAHIDARRRKRAREEDSGTNLPLHVDTKLPKRPRGGHYFSYIRRSKVCTPVTDVPMIRTYAYFDRPASADAAPTRTCHRQVILDACVTHGPPMTLRDLEQLLDDGGFKKETPVQHYEELCAELQNKDAIEVGQEAPYDVTL